MSNSNNEVFRLFKWLLVLIVLTYFTNQVAISIVYSFVIYMFYRSDVEDDYFWIILTFALIDYPGNLFNNMDRAFLKFGMLQFEYLEIFSIVALLKVINKRKRYNSFPAFLKLPYKLYFIYFLFLLAYGVLLVGIGSGGATGYRNIFVFFKIISMTPIFYTLAIIFNNNYIMRKFAKLLFTLLLVNFAGQLFVIFYNESVHTILGGKIVENTDLLVVSSDLVRALFGSFINLISLLVASYIYFSEQNIFSKKYLIFILVICVISMILTASRTWITGYLIYIISLLFLSLFSKYSKTALLRISIMTIPLIILYNSNRTFSYQIDAVFNRFLTLEFLFSGDLTAGGTNVRFTTRSENIMDRVWERPIFGWGISGYSIEHADGHVGNQSILLTGGFIGFSIFVFIWFYFIFKLLSFRNQLDNKDNKIRVYALILFFILTLIIHGGTQRYGYIIFGLSPQTGFITALWFSIISSYYHHPKLTVN